MLMTTFLNYNEDRPVTKDAIYSDDISAEGLRIICPQQLPKGSAIKLKLFLFSDLIPVFVEGKIVWSQKMKESREAFRDNEDKGDEGFCRAGMQLINIDSFERERIRRWIQKELTIVRV